MALLLLLLLLLLVLVLLLLPLRLLLVLPRCRSCCCRCCYCCGGRAKVQVPPAWSAAAEMRHCQRKLTPHCMSHLQARCSVPKPAGGEQRGMQGYKLAKAASCRRRRHRLSMSSAPGALKFTAR